jgi:hypothetical protein
MVLKDIDDIDEERPETMERELFVIKKELKTIDIKSELEKTMLKIQELEGKKDASRFKKAQEKFSKLTEKLNKLEENS